MFDLFCYCLCNVCCVHVLGDRNKSDDRFTLQKPSSAMFLADVLSQYDALVSQVPGLAQWIVS